MFLVAHAGRMVNEPELQAVVQTEVRQRNVRQGGKPLRQGVGDGNLQVTGFLAGAFVSRRQPVRPRNDKGGGQKERQKDEGRAKPYLKRIQHPEGTEKDEWQQVAVHAKLEVVTADDQRVVGHLHPHTESDDAPAQDAFQMRRMLPQPAHDELATAYPHPDRRQRQRDPEPQGVLDDEGKRIPQTAHHPEPARV